MAGPFTAASDNTAWLKASVELAEYQGQTVVLRINQHSNDSSVG